MLFNCYYSFYLYFYSDHFNGQLQQQSVRNNFKKYIILLLLFVLFVFLFGSLQRPTITTDGKKRLRKIMLFYCYYSFYLYFCSDYFNGQLQPQPVRNNKQNRCCSIVTILFICIFVRITSTGNYIDRL